MLGSESHYFTDHLLKEIARSWIPSQPISGPSDGGPPAASVRVAGSLISGIFD